MIVVADTSPFVVLIAIAVDKGPFWFSGISLTARKDASCCEGSYGVARTRNPVSSPRASR